MATTNNKRDAGSPWPRDSTIFYRAKGGRRGEVVFGGTGRGEEYERKDDGVGGGWEDKANQTVNNRGTAERKGSERRAVASGGGGGGGSEGRGLRVRGYDASPAAKLAEFYS